MIYQCCVRCRAQAVAAGGPGFYGAVARALDQLSDWVARVAVQYQPQLVQIPLNVVHPQPSILGPSAPPATPPLGRGYLAANALYQVIEGFWYGLVFTIL